MKQCETHTLIRMWDGFYKCTKCGKVKSIVEWGKYKTEFL
jgi:ribosomal protein L37AE/L43A